MTRLVKDKLTLENARVFKAILLVTFFMFFGKLAGAGKEIAIAYRYGISNTVDVYIYAFVLVTWLPAVMTGILQAILVPLLRKNFGVANELFQAELSGLIVLISVFLSSMLYWLAPDIVSTFAVNFSTSSQSSLIYALRFMVPLLVIYFFISSYSAVLLSREKHFNTLFESIPALSILVFVIFFSTSSESLAPLLFGTLVGSIAHLSALIATLARHQVVMNVCFSFQSPLWMKFKSSISFMLVGSMVMSFVSPIDQYLASQFGDGAVSSLSYGTRLLFLLSGLGVTVVARALLPVLSDASGCTNNARVTVQFWSQLIFVGGGVVALVFWYVAPLLVQVFFERGEFDSAATSLVVEIFRFGLLQFPFLYAGVVMVQYFASKGEYKIIAASGLIAVVAKIIFGFWFSSEFGLKGITLSTGVMYFSTCTYFFYMFRKDGLNKASL